jgi:hypothetical protein
MSGGSLCVRRQGIVEGFLCWTAKANAQKSGRHTRGRARARARDRDARGTLEADGCAYGGQVSIWDVGTASCLVHLSASSRGYACNMADIACKMGGDRDDAESDLGLKEWDALSLSGERWRPQPRTLVTFGWSGERLCGHLAAMPARCMTACR